MNKTEVIRNPEEASTPGKTPGECLGQTARAVTSQTASAGFTKHNTSRSREGLHALGTAIVEVQYKGTAQSLPLKDTLELAAKWIEKCRCDVVLLVCGRCPSDVEPPGKPCHSVVRLSRQQILEWCIERSCELIETQPDEDDDEEDATGVKRIVEALHAHPWPQLEMKGNTANDQSSSLATGDSEEASRDFKLFSEAMATDGEDMSFEELFAKFKDMKVQADKLSGEDRKKFAEKVAIQFWRAFGGEDDEVCGLSSEDEAEK
ncbi:hypothetical protein HPB48_007442 [Haemaphysalis longicornis]|uniref:Alpha-and gamma-adaptin-binding protein p34 n=1 Tax=Haemaphysalis longicornis TaxID=44386 RepID=A0A9J6G4N7_HAELO|nr:hypothetical protein HPB48_007442 [Haemaphysalis longicornis]